MKYEFSKSVQFRPEWNDNLALPKEEQVSMTVGVLSMGHMLELMDALESQSKDGQADTDSLDNATTGKLVTMATSMLPAYVSEFVGLEGPEGAVALSDVCAFPQFIGLIIEILFQLISISTPNEDDSKN